MSHGFIPGLLLGALLGVAGTYYHEHGADQWMVQFKKDMPSDASVDKKKVQEHIQEGKKLLEEEGGKALEEIQSN